MDQAEQIKLKKALEREKDKNAVLEQDNEMLRRMLDDVYQSTSWKLTRPVREAGNLAKNIGIFGKIKKVRTFFRVLGESGPSGVLLTAKRLRNLKAEGDPGDVSPDADYQDDCDFTAYDTDVKMLAFYLPQYHTFAENDEWWGKGFTEWTNVRKGEPRFEGHYQPRVPHKDIGYYDLSDIKTLKQQARLMKEHGIYGLCVYYYWFSGKRLMEKPIDMLLEHPEIDLPFCLCWANENWTRTWDGQNNNILIAQRYSEEDDRNFIPDMKKYLDDSRYIRIGGKPLIMVYNPKQIPDCHKSFARWRETAREIGIGDILIWTMQTANSTAESIGITDCIDAEVDFPPHNMWWNDAMLNNVDTHEKIAHIFDYNKIADHAMRRMEIEDPPVPLHHTCMMAWDNAARKKSEWFTYCRFSLKTLYRWVAAISEHARKNFDEQERFVFVNAWNEWGEGTYTEPDERFGYATINTISKALMGLPYYDDLKAISANAPAIDVSVFERKDAAPRIAVQIHLFYTDLIEEIIENLNQIPFRFDCYISTDTEEKKAVIEKNFTSLCHSVHNTVEVYPNKGRDVLPFLMQMKDRINSYDYICHIHSKKTSTDEHGNDWRRYLFDHLFGNTEYVKRLFYLFEKDSYIGILMPETYPVLELQAEWGGNKLGVQKLLSRFGITSELPKNPVFPVGDMFWARTEAISELFCGEIDETDFPEENGQTNATLAHEIERCWIYLIRGKGFHYLKVFNNCPEHDSGISTKRRILIYAHYDKENRLSEDDCVSFQKMTALAEESWFVSNCPLNQDGLDSVRQMTDHIRIRKNIGFDFGAWKEILLENRENISNHDELILANNSCYPPVFDLGRVFEKMEEETADFWGIALFPYCPDGSYIHQDHIDEHIQSYFMVFRKNVLQSDAFWHFWESLPESTDLIEAIANGESRLTSVLKDAGLSYCPYIRETYYIHRFLNDYSIPYTKPASLLLLKDPFIKKKSYGSMNQEEEIKLEFLRKEFG